MTEVTDTNLIKHELLVTFFRKYRDLIQYVENLPIDVRFKQNAISRFDEGMYWTREAIGFIQTVAPEAVTEPKPLE